MTVKELEERVVALEEQVKRLSSELATTNGRRTKNWRAAVEKFSGDEDILSILADANKLREQDRKRARSKRGARGKSRK